MKYFKFYCHIWFAVLYTQSGLFSQTIYPPNYSFEDDTVTYNVEPWTVQGKYSTFSSFGMNLPTDRYRLFAMQSFKVRDTITNSKISIKFPLNQRVIFLKFDAIFFSQFDFENFGVKVILTKHDQFKSEIVTICKLDTLMDTICNFRDYRSNWVTSKIDLTRFYLNSDIPDSCYIEFNCDVDYTGPDNFNQSLFLDNIKFTLNENTELTNQIDNSNFLVYPNPSSKVIKIDLKGEKPMQSVQVFDALGRKVIQQQANSNQIEIDVSCLATGNYILKIEDENHQVFTRQLIVE